MDGLTGKRTADFPVGASTENWHNRGYLPHYDAPALQFLTFRLADSLPIHVLKSLEDRVHDQPEKERGRQLARLANHALDHGLGACWLRRPEIASITQNALFHFHGDRYRLFEWVVMPNHVHVLVETFPDFPIAKVVQSWKGFISREANQHLKRTGTFWYRDYFDRFMRDARHFENTAAYIRLNPVKAGLCERAEDWEWSSAGKHPIGLPASPSSRRLESRRSDLPS